VSYWKANPHQWGMGRTHRLHKDGGKTLCGRKLADVPGHYVAEGESECDCQGCATVMLAEERRQADAQRWAERSRQQQLEREATEAEWSRKYNAYLRYSPEWQARRSKVLKRERGICQSCGEARATEVHHTPAAYRHVFHEPLFELVALCRKCHEEITAMDKGQLA
jgi:5-methylcytosine-specific restriction endonuclease McrA